MHINEPHICLLCHCLCAFACSCVTPCAHRVQPCRRATANNGYHSCLRFYATAAGRSAHFQPAPGADTKIFGSTGPAPLDGRTAAPPLPAQTVIHHSCSTGSDGGAVVRWVQWQLPRSAPSSSMRVSGEHWGRCSGTEQPAPGPAAAARCTPQELLTPALQQHTERSVRLTSSAAHQAAA